MSLSRIYLTMSVFCTILLIAQSGTWLSFNHKAHSPNNLIPYLITSKDLTDVLEMCKEDFNKRRVITQQERSRAEICDALLDLISGR